MPTSIETAKLALPEVDTSFQLNIKNYSNPLGILTLYGFDFNWKFLGPSCRGQNVLLNAMLKNFGSVNFMQAAEKANKLGYRLLEGQAAETVMEYETKKNAVIMFGGSQWKIVDGSTRIICVYTKCQADGHWDWKLGVPWSADKCNEGDLWIVVEEKITRSSQLHSSGFPLR